ncbi:hypothetical protein ACH5RR_020836 [Cinchona calisaya]|uniref:Glycosyltransferase n=1 Tax=Cinchona calisaya TaxID=153742 RepID=A0ABD2ZFK7_9GENT
MEKPKNAFKGHCLVVPYPTPGHINPMLQFSRRLEHRGVKVTLAVTEYIFKTMQDVAFSSISVETFSDGKVADVETDIQDYLVRLQENGTKTLTKLVEKLCASDDDHNDPLICIVYDSFLPWALDVARKFRLVSAVFLTQSASVSNIYYHVWNGSLRLPLSESSRVFIPGLPPLEASETPSFLHIYGSYPAIREFLVDQFKNFHQADWIFFNTFYKLEEKVVDWMTKNWPMVRTIGPTLASMLMDKRINEDKDYVLNCYNPNTDSCMKWLNERPDSSVAYVSFGSIAELGKEQFQELAWGLKNSNVYFLFVVRSKEQSKLPKGFLEENSKSEKGLVVSWCPQLKVLEHKALGCFVTHCGWNSTLEALSFGVPVVAMPQWSDQITNAKFIDNVWGNGVKAARTNDSGLITREEVEFLLKEVMEGEKGEEIRKNASKWKELAKEAVDEGGSSDEAINEFVANIVGY